MTEGHRDAKICPILAAFSGARDTVSTASTWAIRCKGAECAWWNVAHQACAIEVIAQQMPEVSVK